MSRLLVLAALGLLMIPADASAFGRWGPGNGPVRSHLRGPAAGGCPQAAGMNPVVAPAACVCAASGQGCTCYRVGFPACASANCPAGAAGQSCPGGVCRPVFR